MPMIQLSDEAVKRITNYAEVTGITVKQAASQACIKWMEATGDDVMYILQKRRKSLHAAPTPLQATPRTLLKTANLT